MGHVPEVVLSSGHKMPLLGLGTMAAPLPPLEALTATLIEAIELGYRHFDTALIYGSEEAVGRAVAEALERGLIKGRDDVFITSKLWSNDAAPHLVLPALKNTLRQHHCPSKLAQILESCSIPPAVNQVEMHVAWRQEQLREFCKQKGIHVSAWSPLGSSRDTAWSCPAVMESPVLKDIAQAKGKTMAQIALRWVHQEEGSVIVKSFNARRMKENLDIFDWELTEERNSIRSRKFHPAGDSVLIFSSMKMDPISPLMNFGLN